MILVFIIFIIVLLCFIEVRINIENMNLYIGLEEINGENFVFESNAYLEVYLFKTLRIVRFKLNDNDVKNRVKKDNISGSEILDIIIKRIIGNIKNVNIKIDVETKNYMLTSSVIVLFSTILSVLYGNYLKESKRDQYKFRVYSNYINKNMLNMELNSIISLKIVHIISIIIILIKRKGLNKNERTSNRRSYDYSYEQH